MATASVRRKAALKAATKLKLAASKTAANKSTSEAASSKAARKTSTDKHWNIKDITAKEDDRYYVKWSDGTQSWQSLTDLKADLLLAQIEARKGTTLVPVNQRSSAEILFYRITSNKLYVEWETHGPEIMDVEVAVADYFTHKSGTSFKEDLVNFKIAPSSKHSFSELRTLVPNFGKLIYEDLPSSPLESLSDSEKSVTHPFVQNMVLHSEAAIASVIATLFSTAVTAQNLEGTIKVEMQGSILSFFNDISIVEVHDQEEKIIGIIEAKRSVNIDTRLLDCSDVMEVMLYAYYYMRTVDVTEMWCVLTNLQTWHIWKMQKQGHDKLASLVYHKVPNCDKVDYQNTVLIILKLITGTGTSQ